MKRKRYARTFLGLIEMLDDAGYQTITRFGTGKQIMARQGLTKEQQINGLRKALANRKTPRAFIPSMKKRLAKLSRG